MFLYVKLLFVAGLLFGCASKLTESDKVSANVMPQSVAIKIFQKYGLQNATKPFSGGLPPICGGGLINDVLITEVTRFSYFPKNRQVILGSRSFFDGRCPVNSAINNVQNEASARELLQAAIALGAKVDKIYIVKAFWE